MTTLNLSMIGALSAEDIDITWDDLVAKYRPLVKRLQMRIAKAIREGKHGKAKSLQWLLTRSFSAKILAVKRVTSNSGKRTAGIDGVVWSTSLSKIKAISNLSRRGYKASPLRRVLIPKKNGKQRALGIPTMRDRAMQALHLLALEPISESILEPNYYGFRPFRSTADAIEQCFKCLAKKHQAQWILEGDIKSCFDEINHNWLMSNIKTDKQILDKWLKSGIINRNKLHEEFYETNKGTPQGSIISPTLANITLNGMESLFKDIPGKHKVHVIIYADDFVVTAKSKEILQELVKPRIEAFLKKRGLQLSQEKTAITHINEGFDFLGFNVRKYKEKLFVKPSKGSIKDFLQDAKGIIKTHKTAKTEDIIHLLNPKIRGWANYYRHVVSKEVFNYIDENIHWSLWKWSKRKHPNKSSAWTKSKYYRSNGSDNWIFHAKTKHQGKTNFLDLVQASKIPIIRHVKIRGHANPFDPNYKEYFQNRKIRENNSCKKERKEMISIRNRTKIAGLSI